VGMRYEQLTDSQKVTYDELVNGMAEYATDIYLSQETYTEDLNIVYDAIVNTDSTELVSTIRKYEYKYDESTGKVSRVRPQYVVSQEVRNSMVEDVQSVVDSVVESVQGLDDFETVKVFHDYIITHCDYDTSAENSLNAYGALVEGKAVCEGYSRAFKYLCDTVGIPCELVLGTAEGEHMWNLVQLNGQWYNSDITWDDPENKGGDYIAYNYFNLTDSQIAKDHTVDDSCNFPNATSTDLNYFIHENLCAESLEELYNIIYSEVYKACTYGNRYVYVSVNTPELYEQALTTLSDNDWYVTYNIVKNACYSASTSMEDFKVTCSYNDTVLSFTLSLW
jgi:hypothetical protein